MSAEKQKANRTNATGKRRQAMKSRVSKPLSADTILCPHCRLFFRARIGMRSYVRRSPWPLDDYIVFVRKANILRLVVIFTACLTSLIRITSLRKNQKYRDAFYKNYILTYELFCESIVKLRQRWELDKRFIGCEYRFHIQKSYCCKESSN